MRVLLTDGNERVTLAAARSLVRAGHTVSVTAATRWSLAGVSRGVQHCVLGCDPLADPAGYVAELGRIARQDRVEILLPTTDASMEAVLEYGTALPREVRTAAPDLATYRAASDKAMMLELGRRCGFEGPVSRVLATPGAKVRRELGAEDLFPAVIKPHRSVVTVQGTRRKLAVVPVADAVACDAVLAALPREAYPVLVQRRISGVGEGLFALRWGGRVIAIFAHRRLREKPPSGGVSVYRESIALTEELERPAVRLLDALDWQGVAMIECKREAGTGRHVLMEVNGRFWGSLQLAIDAGVDFPALLMKCVAGENVPECRDYRVGVRSRWFWGDVDNLLLTLRDGPAGASSRSRVGAVRDFLLACMRQDQTEVWRWSDPLPFALETVRWFGLLTHSTAGAKPRSRAAPRECVPDSAVP